MLLLLLLRSVWDTRSFAWILACQQQGIILYRVNVWCEGPTKRFSTECRVEYQIKKFDNSNLQGKFRYRRVRDIENNISKILTWREIEKRFQLAGARVTDQSLTNHKRTTENY